MLKPFLRHLTHAGLALSPFRKHPIAGRRRRHAGRRGFTIAHEALEQRSMLSGVPTIVSASGPLSLSWDMTTSAGYTTDFATVSPAATDVAPLATTSQGGAATEGVYEVVAAPGMSAAAAANLSAGVAKADAVLGQIFASDDVEGVLRDVFGRAGSDDATFSAAVAAVRRDWSAGGLGIAVEAVGSAAIGRAMGAFAAQAGGAPRIFVNADWLAGADADAVAGVLLEEFGHSLDVRLNGGADSPGDEGEYFAAAAATGVAGIANRAAILGEDDHGQILVAGRSLAVEFAAEAISSGSLGTNLTATQTFGRTAAEALTVTITYNGANSNGADILIAAYNGSTLIGWTVYNRTTNLDAGGTGQTTTLTGLTFNLAQFNTNITTGGLNLRAWQGTAGGSTAVGTANNTTPAQTSGTSSTVPFAVDTITANGTDVAIPAAGLASTTWTNTTVSVVNGVSSVALTASTGAQNNRLNVGDTVTATVTFGAAVTVTGTPTLTLNVGGTNRTASYVSGSTTTALLFTYTIQAGDTDTDGISIAADSLALNGGTITSGGANASLTHAAVAANASYLVDTTAPTVSSVVATGTGITSGSGTLKAGAVVTLTVNTSEAVTVNTTGGTPTLSLSSGGTASYASGSGTSALVFTYTVGASDSTSDLTVTALNANGGTLLDAAGNALATFTANPAGTLVIDTTLPTVSSVAATGTGITSGSGTLKAGAVVTLTVNTSEAVTVNTSGGTPTLSLSSGGTASYSSGSGTTALVFTYTVGATDSTSDLTVTALNANGGTLLDAAGNTLATFTANPAGTLVIDTTAPTVSSVAITSSSGGQNSTLNAGDTVTATVTMSEAVTVGGSPTLQLTIGSTTVTATYNAASSTSTLLRFNYTILAGQTDTNGISIASNSLALNGGTIADAAGNAATLTHSAVTDDGSYLVDTTLPTVSSVAITASSGGQNSTLNAGDTVTVTVTLSESVTVTGTPTVTLNVGGTSRAASYVSGSGSNALLFTYTVQAGDNDANGISINANSLALAGGTIADAVGNSAILTHAAVADNASYKVDTTAPTVSTVAITSATGGQNGTLNAGDVVTATVTMSESVTVTGTPTLQLTIGSTTVTATYSAASSSPTLLRFTYTILAGQTDTNGISIASNSLALAGGTIADAAGNAATLAHAAVADNASYKVDTTAPVITSGSTAAIKSNTNVLYTATATDAGGSITYSIQGTPTLGGVATSLTIGSGTGVVTTASGLAQVGTYVFTVAASDPAGNVTTREVTVTVTAAPAAIDLMSASADWNPLLAGTKWDPNNDTQANASKGIDLVGNPSAPMLYSRYDATANGGQGEIALRLRQETVSPRGVFYLLGLINPAVDGSRIVGFIGVNVASNSTINGSGVPSNATVSFYDPGAGANNSPSTSSFTNARAAVNASVRVRAVDEANDLDGDGATDGFVSFKFNAEDFRTWAATSGRLGSGYQLGDSLGVVVMTATQTNSINGDFGGITGGGSSTQTFSQLGIVVPESLANNPPQSQDARKSVNEDTTTVIPAAAFPFVDTDPGDTFAKVRIDSLPAKGTFLLDGVAVTAGAEITKAQLDANKLTFRAATDETGTDYTTFEFSVSDGKAYSYIPRTMTIDVLPANDPPSIYLLDGDISYWSTSNVPVAIDASPNASVGDADSADFDGGVLSIGVSGGTSAHNALTIGTTASITVSGSTVSYNGTPIGTISGSGTTALTVTFNASATTAAVSAVISATRYTYSGSEAAPDQRSISFVVTDGDGGTSNTATVTMVGPPVYAVSGSEDTTISADQVPGNVGGSSTVGDLAAASGTHVKILSVSGSLTSSAGAVTVGTVLTIAQLRTVTFTPAANDYGDGLAGFRFQYTDAGGTPTGVLQQPTVVFDVTPVNDAPVAAADGVSGAVLLGAIEETAGASASSATRTATGTAVFSDVDFSDTLTVSLTGSNGYTWSGGTLSGAQLTALDAAISLALGSPTYATTAAAQWVSAGWTFSAADSTFDFLAAGETLDVTRTVQVSDGVATASTTIEVTITGTNDPVIVTTTDAAQFAGTVTVTGAGSTPATATGAFDFTDLDGSDTHSATVSTPLLEWFDGTTLRTAAELETAIGSSAYAAVVSAVNAAMVAALASPTATTVAWTFTPTPSSAFAFLRPDESLTLTYAIQVEDGNGSSASKDVVITLNGANDPPKLNLNGLQSVGDSSREVTFVSSNPSVPVALTASSVTNLSDVDSTAFSSIQFCVAVSELDDGNNEALVVNGAAETTRILLGGNGTTTFSLGGVSHTATVTTENRTVEGSTVSCRIITFTRTSGLLSTAEAEALLDAISYDNTAFPPSPADRRTFEVTVTDDDGATSAASNLVVTVQTGTPPVIDLNGGEAGIGRVVTFTEGDSGVAAAASGVTNLTPADALFDRVGIGFNPLDFVDGSHEAMIIAGIQEGDTALTVLPFNGAIGTVGTFTLGGLTYRYEYILAGSLHRIFVTKNGGGHLTQPEAERVIDAYQYRNTSENPTTTAPRSINFGTLAAGVFNTPATLTVNLVAVNDAPVVVAGGTLSYTENGSAAAIDTGVTVTDVDSANLVGATVTISSGLTTGDILGFTNQAGITGTWNAGTGVLTLTGTATVAAYQSALRSVTYRSTSDGPGQTSASRTVTWQVDDGAAANNLSAPVTSSISITSVNDAPSGTDATITLLEDGSHILGQADFGYTDPLDSPADALASVVIVTLPAAGSLRYDGVAITQGQVDAGYSVSAADIDAGKLVFVPAANAFGAGYASFQFKVRDDGGTANGGVDLDPSANTITFDVTGVLDPILVSLVTDSGFSASDAYTNVGTISTTSPDPGFSVEYSIDEGATWTGSFKAVEGSNTVWARQTDGVQTSSVVAGSKLTFTLDTRVIAIGAVLQSDTGNSASDRITSNGALSLVGAESGGKVQYSTNGGTDWSESYSSVEGLNSLRLRQIDKAGNISVTTGFVFTRDTVANAPTVSLSSDTPSGSGPDLVTRVGTLSVTGAEVGSRLEYSTSSGAGWNAWATSFKATEGLNTVRVRQTDVSGNVSSPTEFTFTLDTKAPAAPVVALKTDTGKSATDKVTSVGTLSLSGIESYGAQARIPSALVEYSTNGGASWAGSFAPVKGVNTVRVRQVDLAGNISPQAIFSFTFDNDAPVTPPVGLASDTGASATDRITSEGTLKVTAEANATVEYSTNKGATWSPSFTPVLGSNTVNVRQTDLAGNVGKASTITFTYDNVAPAAPTVALASDTPNGSTPDLITSKGNLSVSGTEANATVQYSTWNGSAWTAWSTAFNAAQGLNVVRVRQLDVAGNASVAPSDPLLAFRFTFDTVAPTVTNVTLPASGLYTVGQTLSFTVKFSEAVTYTGTNTPFLAIKFGSVTRNALLASGNGTDTFVFTYTIAAGDSAPSGIEFATTVSLPNGTTLRDRAGNNANLSITLPSTRPVVRS